MKLTVDRAALLKALSHVQSVVERRNTIPILSNVLITAAADGVSFTATDLDIEIIDKADADLGEPGVVTAPAHTLYEIVRKLPDGAEATLATGADEARLTLSAGRSRFALPLLPPSDFPAMTADDFSHTFQLEAETLARLIDKTRFAISTEETRYYLNGVHLHALAGESPTLRAVATDGHRLALAETALPEGAAGLPGVIVPRKTVAELRRLLDDAEELIDVSVSDAKIRFGLGRAVLTSKLIDGAFPDYERVIPKQNDRVMAVDNKSFAQAVDRVATISAEKSRSVKLTMDDDTLTFTVNNPESGQATEEMQVDFGGERLDIGFNARYLLDVTTQVEGEEAEFRFADAASPTLIKDRGDDRALYVLMPLRV
ncbi:MAG: DNA polymerase III subunit beta [Maricaulaceae bacterium]